MMRHNLIRYWFMTMVSVLLIGLGGNAKANAIRPEEGPDLFDHQQPSASLLPDIFVGELVQPLQSLPIWSLPPSASTSIGTGGLSAPGRFDISIDPISELVDPPSEDEALTDQPEESRSSVLTPRPDPIAPTNDRQSTDFEPDGATPRNRSPERHIEVEALAPTRPFTDQPTVEAEDLQDGDHLEEAHVPRVNQPTDALTDPTDLGVEDRASRLDDGRLQQPNLEAPSIDESPKSQVGGGEASFATPSDHPTDDAFPPVGTGRSQKQEFDGRSDLIGQSGQDSRFEPEDHGTGRGQSKNNPIFDQVGNEALEANLSDEFGEALDLTGISRTTELTDSSWIFASDDDLLGEILPIPQWNTNANLEALIQSSIEAELLRRTHSDSSSILTLEVAEEDVTAGSDRMIPPSGDRIALVISTPEPTPLIPIALVLLIGGVQRWSKRSVGVKAHPF